MRNELKKRCELFADNNAVFKSAFIFESAYIRPVCAAMYTVKGKTADAERLRLSKDILKQNTGIFSSFRGFSRLAIISSISLSENPEDKMSRILDIYSKLKKVFWSSDYLTLAAACIADLASPYDYEEIAGKTKIIYERMKKNHPFLTSREDSAFAALLALSGLNDEFVEREMERCYNILKNSFFSSNSVQSLSHVLALGNGNAESKCGKVLELFDYMKKRGYRYGTSYELSSLGAIAIVDADVSAIAEDVMAVADFFKVQKSFGIFGVSSRQRLMYAGLLAMCDYVPEFYTMQSAALNGVVSLVIAQQAALCASMTAAHAAAQAASSSAST